MDRNKPIEEKTTTSINFEMDATTNDVIEKSSKESGRTKRSEAQARLKDHAERYKHTSHGYVLK